MSATLGKLERVEVRDTWPNEAQHFTPWLASEPGLKLLGETLGVELELETTEKFVGPFKADILAKRTDTVDDHYVLIENQLERTDHLHLGQLLTYAAGLKAATIIWVAINFTDEHRAALDWLNEITADSFEFYGLEIELWKIGESAPAPKLNLVVRPNDWSRATKSASASDLSPLKKQQQRYWQALGARIIEQKAPFKPQAAQPQHWSNYALGRTGIWMSATMDTKSNRIAVECRVQGPPGKIWFDVLEGEKPVIEAEIGKTLLWNRLPERKQSSIILYEKPVNPKNEADWPKQHEWFVQTLCAFHKAFAHRAKQLPGVSESEDTDDTVPAEGPNG